MNDLLWILIKFEATIELSGFLPGKFPLNLLGCLKSNFWKNFQIWAWSRHDPRARHFLSSPLHTSPTNSLLHNHYPFPSSFLRYPLSHRHHGISSHGSGFDSHHPTSILSSITRKFVLPWPLKYWWFKLSCIMTYSWPSSVLFASVTSKWNHRM